MDRDAVVGAFEQALDREGWLALFETREWIPEWVDVHLDLAAAFAVGTVLTRRGDEVFVRSGPVADQ